MNVFLVAALLALIPVAAALVVLFRTLSSQSNLDVSTDGGLVL